MPTSGVAREIAQKAPFVSMPSTVLTARVVLPFGIMRSHVRHALAIAQVAPTGPREKSSDRALNGVRWFEAGCLVACARRCYSAAVGDLPDKTNRRRRVTWTLDRFRKRARLSVEGEKLMVPAERRRAPRVPLNAPVVLRVDSQAIECAAENISRTGIFVRTASSFPPGSRVSLRCKLPFGVMAVDAVVVHCRPGDDHTAAGLGLRFHGQTSIADAYLSALCGPGSESF